MSEAAPPQTPVAPPVGSLAHQPALPRGLTLAALAVLLMFIAMQGRALWHEWSVLRKELSGVRASAVIGYPGIQPRYSYAQKPADWFKNEGDSTLLWGGWRHDEGHLWFRVGRGEVDRARISEPIGRDVMLAIDYPVVEFAGGTIWERVPDDAFVAGDHLGGVDTAYPLLILDKVVVVNDTIREKPFLVTWNPRAADEERITVYEPVVDGHRLTMGLSGYFHDSKPLLYDRGTESLWVHAGDALRAIAGKHKGQALPRISHPVPVSWSHWRSQHPESRLVVGADRTKERPGL